MILSANLKEAFTSLLASKQRSILALIGIIIGIGSVIAMVSVGIIAQNEVLKQFKEMGTDILSIEKAYSPGPKIEITLPQAMGIAEHCPAVRLVAPYGSAYGKLSYNGKRFDVPALGLMQSAYQLYKLNLNSGRFIYDLDGQMNFAVLSAHLANQLKKAGMSEIQGAKIVYQGKIFTLLGSIDMIPMGGMKPFELQRGLIIPLSNLLRFPNRPEISKIIVKINPGFSHKQAEQQIKAYFAKSNSKLKLRVTSAEELVAKMQQQMQLFTMLLGAIGSISLIVGGVGVMNVMLVSVSERRKEIGIRRALGARQNDIQTQFLIEALVLCFIGGIIGIGVGVGASWGVAYFSHWAFVFSPMPAILGVGVSAVVGIFFGFYPARQAAKLSPIDALRGD